MRFAVEERSWSDFCMSYVMNLCNIFLHGWNGRVNSFEWSQSSGMCIVTTENAYHIVVHNL
jgi:hypothetical protein